MIRFHRLVFFRDWWKLQEFARTDHRSAQALRIVKLCLTFSERAIVETQFVAKSNFLRRKHPYRIHFVNLAHLNDRLTVRITAVG